MSEQINLEAERAAPELAPCPFCASNDVAIHEHHTAGSYMVLCHNCTAEGPLHETKALAVEWWNRRTAPVSAPIVEELPPRPAVQLNGIGFYSAKQIGELVSPYAERIRQLERELAERGNSSNFSSSCGQCPRDTPYGPATCGKCMGAQERKTASIEEDNKFQCLLYHYVNARSKLVRGKPTEDDAIAAFRELIAYIDGRTAGTAPEAVAAMERAKKLPVWDDIDHRLHGELDIIFKAIAATPTPTEEAK